MLAAGLVASRPVSAGGTPSPWLQEQIADMHAINGRYANANYGFSIAPPPRAATYIGNAPNPNHGVIIILGERRMIRVYARYSDPDFGNDKPCGPLFQAHPGAKVRSQGKIGARAACALTVSDDANFEQVREQTGDDRGTKILYTVQLTTTREAKAADLAALDAVAASFTRVPIVP